MSKKLLGIIIVLGPLALVAPAKTPPTTFPTSRPATLQAVTRPTTQGAVVHPTTTVAVTHPTRVGAVTHPTTTVLVSHPVTQGVVLHPSTQVATVHPTTQVAVQHPQTTTVVTHPQTPGFDVKNRPGMARAGGGGTAASLPGVGGKSAAGSMMSGYKPPQAKAFTKPEEKAAPLGGGSMNLGNTTNQAEKDNAAASSLLEQNNTKGLDTVDPKQSSLL